MNVNATIRLTNREDQPMIDRLDALREDAEAERQELGSYGNARRRYLRVLRRSSGCPKATSHLVTGAWAENMKTLNIE